ncbi:MAG: flagellar hook-associated protein FlgK [Armatimonadetes bacterium]|nr:flagellar hook-associated protein FlgK [Armatimonadota bacterium]
MPSAFHGINMSSQALRVFQRALDTTGHNISNVNTPGYSRQMVQFADMEPTLFYSAPNRFALGNGVSISAISRVRDLFLQGRRMETTSEQGQLDSYRTQLKGMEQLYNGLGDSGVIGAMNDFYNAWSSLASNPNEPGARLKVQMAGQKLADTVRGNYNNLRSMQTQASLQVDQTIKQVDQLTTQIADLNASIRIQKAQGVEPNDLYDQRDQALHALSDLVDVKTFNQPDGSVNVFMGSRILVDQAGATPFPSGSYDTLASTVSDGVSNYPVRGGQLAGLFKGMQAIKDGMAQLDGFANQLRTQVNGIHASGTNPLGNTGVNFFGDVTPPTPQSGAIDFDLSAAVKADPNAIVSSATGLAGDGGLALQLSRMRDVPVAALGNKTFGKYLTDMIGANGREISNVNAAIETQGAISEQIDAQIQSTSGVSLDDEMANMLRYQRSYQAVAKAFNIFDQVTEELINLIR